MAIIKSMPSKDVVDGFRGVLDYYTWCDLVIVRSWPTRQKPHTSPREAAARERFIYINKLAPTLPPNVKATLEELAASGGLTWKDWLNRLYLSGAWHGKDKPIT